MPEPVYNDFRLSTHFFVWIISIMCRFSLVLFTLITICSGGNEQFLCSGRKKRNIKPHTSNDKKCSEDYDKNRNCFQYFFSHAYRNSICYINHCRHHRNCS